LEDLESTNRQLREELRVKDNKLTELSNDSLRSANDVAKKLALVEQEREFLKREV
jgi:hypothetical protein